MMPKQKDVEVPLLRCVQELGGQAKARDIYPHMRKFFPELTEEDLAETLASGTNKWTNRIQWVRQRLVAKRELDSPQHGIWAITDAGRKRIAAPSAETTDLVVPNLDELAEEYLSAFKQKVLQKLQDLTPVEFERFGSFLLSAYGFADVQVTARTADGGIDGHGKLKVGLAFMEVAFQCKKWKGSVPRPEVDKFRGAIQGKFEQGVFFTTSDFSRQARENSIRKGAAPIVLLNGEAIVQLMIDKGLGIRRIPVEIYEDQIDSLFDVEAE